MPLIITRHKAKPDQIFGLGSHRLRTPVSSLCASYSAGYPLSTVRGAAVATESSLYDPSHMCAMLERRSAVLRVEGDRHTEDAVGREFNEYRRLLQAVQFAMNSR